MAGVALGLALLGVIATLVQTSNACQSCKTLSKDEKAMFRAHSDSCLEESQVDPKLVADLFRGELVEDAKLKKHVYCMLLKCKMISKDGKLQKATVLGRFPPALNASAAMKFVDDCAAVTGNTPEEVAWNIFKCGYEKKSILFNYETAATPVKVEKRSDQRADKPAELIDGKIPIKDDHPKEEIDKLLRGSKIEGKMSEITPVGKVAMTPGRVTSAKEPASAK